jgi:hypothetical protein
VAETISDDSIQLCLCLSEAAVMGVESPKSLRFLGHIKGHDILILVDSESSHSFLSNVVVGQLSGRSSLPKPLSVQVANGTPIVYQTQFQNAEWVVQGCKFSSDLKVIPLQHFDMIVGFDWLEQFSPMRVH